MKLNNILPIVLILVSSCTGPSGDPAITGEDLKQHIEYLASQELQGRLPGTDGDLMAATYIRNELESFGLHPLVDDGFQKFDIAADVVPGNDNLFVAGGKEYKQGEDFSPFSFSENSDFTGEVIFAGYGFTIDTDTLRWNDYNGIDPAGKVVMILRADPEVDISTSGYASFSNDRDKCMAARDMGASAVLLVSGYTYDQTDEFESLVKGEYSAGIPAFRIKREVADELLAGSGTTISSLEKKLNDSRSPSSFSTGVSASGKSDVKTKMAGTENVVMVLNGNDPSLSDEYLVIGGHFDHLGQGGEGSSSRALDTVGVHPGADDNASGVASMLEIAQKAAATGENGRSIIFAAFTGEEMGLLGSKYLVDNFPVDPAMVDAMINLDMVGRMKEEKTLEIGGVGTAKRLTEIINSHTDSTLYRFSLSEEGYGPSDHSSFYGKDIPVLFFSTGAHLDYHTPYDTPDKINYEGLRAVTELVYDITEELSNDPDKLVFREAGPRVEVSRGMRRKGVTLGIMPDFAGNVKNGLRADFVTPGKPADRGGMIKGDIITAINGMPVNNINDYMYRMSKFNFGETITVEVMRNGKKEVLLISL